VFATRHEEIAMAYSSDRPLFVSYRRTGDPVVREAIVTRYLPLVHKVARRYDHTSEPYDDILQVGSIGLLKAIDRFDLDRSYAFSSFAVPTIAGEIKRHFRDRTWSVKVPRSAQETMQRVVASERELETALGRSPTAAEVAEALGIGLEDVLDARAVALARTTASLDAPRAYDEPDGRRELDRHRAEEPGYAAVEAAATVRPLLERLDPREREIVRLYFEEDLTQVAIAGRLGLSQMHISRLLRQAIADLGAVLEAQAR
jgi:RNA polymerase sigma-B factor